MVDSNVKLLENGVTHLRDNGDVRFSFWRRLSSQGDVSLNIICLNVLEGIKQFILVNVVQENPTRTTV